MLVAESPDYSYCITHTLSIASIYSLTIEFILNQRLLSGV